MNMSINVEPRRYTVVSEIVARAGAVFRGHYVGAHTKCVIDATDEKWKSASAMRKRDAQAREPFEHAAKNHRANCERRLRRHADQPWQPVFRHTIATQHIPRVNKNCGIDFFSSAPNWL